MCRHALSLLNAHATMYPSVVAQGILNRLREEVQLLNFADNTCVVYIFKICFTLMDEGSSSRSSAVHGDPGVSDEVRCQLYEAVLRLAKNSRSTKISLDALKFVLTVPRTWYFVKDLLKKGTNVTYDCVQVVVRHLTAPVMYIRDGALRETLSSSLSSTTASPSSPSPSKVSSGEGGNVPLGAGGGKLDPDNLFFPLVMRNCIRLGNFLTRRPEGLSLALVTSKRRPSSKKSNTESQEEESDRNSFESTKRPSFTSETSRMHTNVKDIERENLTYLDEILRPVGQVLIGMIRQIKASATPFPHALADIMKALIWTAPDPVYDTDTDKVDHLDLWEWLSQQLSLSLGMIGSDLCMDIIRNVAGR